MIKERVARASEKTEQMLLIGMCKDYGNFNKVKRYIAEEDFSNEEFSKSYSAIKSLYENSGYKKIDEYAVDTYAVDKNLSAEEKGRLSTFILLGKSITVDFDGTYSQFRRNSGMLKFIKKSENFGGIDNMMYDLYEKTESADQLKAEMDNLNKMCFKSYKSSIKNVSLAEGMVDYVKNEMFAKDGRSIDFMKMPLIQSYSKGIHVGVTFLLAQSGKGKTSFLVPQFALPMIESGQKVLSIHNEQEEHELRALYLMSYITRVKGNKAKLHRDNFNSMNAHKITKEQMDYLIESAREFEERYKDRLEFVFVPRFNEDDLEALILDYHRKGYDNIVLDTFKSEDSSSGWEGLDGLAKRMDGIAKELGLKIVCTAQSAGHMSWRKYLDVTVIGKSKAIKEVATSMYLFRWLEAEEVPSIVYSYWKKDSTGKSSWVNGMKLDTHYTDSNGNKHEKKYILLFNDKQRKGESGNVIVYEGDLGSLYFREIGITNSVKNDSNGK
ncbi:MAG: DnaB-like helicase N-terminal domain-containing protein [Cetobacterium sp.]